MNEGTLKTTLLEIIKEAENLPESELEVIPGTRIHVKKGRVDEFKASARFYYGLKNNIIVNNDDYIKEVYYELSDELARDEGERVLSKAYELYSMNKSELERFNALNKSLAINAKDKEKYRKILDDLNHRNISDPKAWEEITNLQNTLKTLSDNEIIIRNAIAEIKDKVNSEIKKVAEEEMELLRNNYLNLPRGTEFTVLGPPFNVTILKKDAEVYQALFAITKILENVDPNKEIVMVNNTVCVNPEQALKIEELLSQVNLFKYTKEPVKETESESKLASQYKVNNTFISTIFTEQNRLKAKIDAKNLPSDKLEYDNLTKILDYIKKANLSGFTLVPVWDIAYVLENDRTAFEQLLKETNLFKRYNPNLKMINENEALIAKLKEYQREIENRYNHYPRAYNISLAQVGDTIILKEDEEEYRNISEIMNILQNSKENLISINGCGNINSNDYVKYKELLSNTKYFTPNIMAKKVEEQNSPLIKEVEQELTDLIKKAKATSNAILAEGKEILASDLEEYNLLSRKYTILKNVNPNSNLVEVNGALINSEEAIAYQEVIKELDEVKKKQANRSSLDQVLSEEESKQNSLSPSSEPNTSAKEESKSSEEEKGQEQPAKRKAVKAVRKAKNNEWWKKNWKKVALVGLSAIAIVVALSTLAPTIVYANSCLAMANPALSGILGNINATIVNFFGLTLSEINLNVATSQAFASLATALAKIGVIGIGTVGVVKGLKGIKELDENRLPDPNRKTISRRILDLGEQLIDKSKELGKNLSAKAYEFTENLAHATDNKNELNKQVVNAKIESDPVAIYKEIGDNVKKHTEEEKKEMIEDRINERFNRIKHAEDATYLRSTTISDEPVIKGPAVEPAPVTITIPTDDEILNSISDKSLQIARVDNYNDALKSGNMKKASEYQKLVFDETGIDLSKYNMDNYEELVEARSDVANFMNQMNTTKRSR